MTERKGQTDEELLKIVRTGYMDHKPKTLVKGIYDDAKTELEERAY